MEISEKERLGNRPSEDERVKKGFKTMGFAKWLSLPLGGK